MLKKIGISLLLAFTMLVSTFNVGIVATAYATAPCSSLEECRELQREKRENIAEIKAEEEEVNEYIALVQAEISILRDELADLEDSIGDLESEISDLEGEIEVLEDEIEILEGEIETLEGEIEDLEGEIETLEGEIEDLEGEIEDLEGEIEDLEGEIADNLEILEDTEDRIDVLIDEISNRMRITQRINNTNSFLVILSEAESITDFIRRARTFNRFASEDAELMDELNDLIEFQENLLLELGDQLDQLQDYTDQLQSQVGQLQNQTDELQDQTDELQDQTDQLQERSDQLQDQTDQLQERSDQLEALRNDLERDQRNLEEDQIALIERETAMQDRLYELNLNLIEEEGELLEAILEAEEIIARIPPPPVTPPPAPPQNNAQPNNSHSNNNNTHSNNNAQSNNNTPPVSQAPSASGLAHPMPGARVTSEFGPRGGRHHTGIDLVVVGNQSAPVLASAAGTVTTNQWHGSLGWFVVVSHNINGQPVATLYAHLRYQPSVRVGTVVQQGDRIGTKGSTGNSSGPHLHFEVHPGGWAWGNSVNPRRWINF